MCQGDRGKIKLEEAPLEEKVMALTNDRLILTNKFGVSYRPNFSLFSFTCLREFRADTNDNLVTPLMRNCDAQKLS